MKEFKYKGFTGSVEASIEDECLVGEILFIADIITYEGETIAGIKQAFEAAVDRYLDYCNRHDKNPCKPYSGTFNVRVGAELHRKAIQEAYRRNMNLNEFCIKALNDSINGTSEEAVKAAWDCMVSVTSDQENISFNATANPIQSWRNLSDRVQ